MVLRRRTRNIVVSNSSSLNEWLITSRTASGMDIIGSPAQHKRATFSTIGSPTPMSPPSLLLGSPAVGEFKGWFSNLFHWKVQSFLLYSVDDVTATRNEIIRLFDTLGIVILEDHQWGVLKCRVEDAYDGNSQVQKHMRFRVEISSTSSYIQQCTPRLPQNPMSPPMNPVASIRSRSHFERIHGFETVAALILEKGSLTTFKNVYQRVKSDWSLDGAQSPIITGGPTTSLDQRIMA